MTREEAKEILTHNWTRVDNPNYSESELDEAFFMAIEALSTPSGDLISRADAIEELKGAFYFNTEDCRTAINCINALPSAEAEQGVWEHIESKLADNMFKCSKCGNPLIIPTVDGEPIYNYCLYCGAKMGNAWGERND